MHKEAELNPGHGLDRDVLIELGRPRIVLEQKALVHPIEHEIEDASEWVQDWQTG